MNAQKRSRLGRIENQSGLLSYLVSFIAAFWSWRMGGRIVEEGHTRNNA
jgi:hypothetical protein